MTPAACPDGGGYGLFFRMKDTSNYYALTYFCSGRVTVFSRANGTLNTTALLDMQLPGSSKADSPDLHTIGIQAKGTDFVVVFDGQTVGTFSDESQKEGDIAIYAVSAANAALKVGFSNLEVWTVR